jgi:hypothetical protein
MQNDQHVLTQIKPGGELKQWKGIDLKGKHSDLRDPHCEQI